MEKIYHDQIKRFGLKVKNLRKKRKLTQQELAYRCDIDIRTVQRIERGDFGIGLHILFALAEALEVQPHRLLMRIDGMKVSNNK